MKKIIYLLLIIQMSGCYAMLTDFEDTLTGAAVQKREREQQKKLFLENNPNITDSAKNYIYADNYFSPEDVHYRKFEIGPISGKKYFVYATDDDLYDLIEESRKNYVATHPNVDKEILDYISKGDICIGMNTEQVIATWAKPTSVSTTMTRYGKSEQWGYKITSNGPTYHTGPYPYDFQENTFLSFENDILTYIHY